MKMEDAEALKRQQEEAGALVFALLFCFLLSSCLIQVVSVGRLNDLQTLLLIFKQMFRVCSIGSKVMSAEQLGKLAARKVTALTAILLKLSVTVCFYDRPFFYLSFFFFFFFKFLFKFFFFELG